jgi:hypothetical protein
MQEFEESQKTSQQNLAQTSTDPRAEAKSKSVVQPLYNGAGSSLASVQDAPPSTPASLVKPTLQQELRSGAEAGNLHGQFWLMRSAAVLSRNRRKFGALGRSS